MHCCQNALHSETLQRMIAQQSARYCKWQQLAARGVTLYTHTHARTHARTHTHTLAARGATYLGHGLSLPGLILLPPGFDQLQQGGLLVALLQPLE
jgi:hypothetical protein